MGGYFDYNATAPAHPEVRAAIDKLLADPPGNPSSMHAQGRRARAILDEARRLTASLLGADPSMLVFTSGATESNNIVLRGMTAKRPELTVVTTPIEHHSIVATVAALEQAGSAVVRLPVDSDAKIDFEELSRLTASRPCLVATSWANGESGHITDVERLLDAVAPGTLVHLDAAQAAGRLPIRCGDGVDFLSVSAHKFGGPPGVGVLAIAGDTPLPIVTGGPQERGLRAGTENVPGIVGMGEAARVAAAAREREWERLRELREELWRRITQRPGDLLRISPADGLANTLTVGVAGVAGDVVVSGLDLEGFSVSTGSACAAGAPEPSHVVRGLGVDERYRNGVVRMSMGRNTTEEDVVALAEAFATVVERARRAA
ncbi:MAG: cysteine desulfurase [Deltaproteobacteria bacterium]|nr:MAG: cysteine desulfurase [Deltaproteobacteria bacterium]